MNASAGWTGRYFHTSIVMPDGSIVLMGGRNSQGNGGEMNDTWRSTNNGATWTQMNASSGWIARSGHSSVAMPDGSIVLMGGLTPYWVAPSHSRNDVWRSTDNGATWTQLTSGEWTPRTEHSSVVMPDGSIILMGGQMPSKNDVWRFQPAGSSEMAKIGIYNNGNWYIDINGDGQFIPANGDRYIPYGASGWTQVVGDWNGDGKSEIGIFKDGLWYIDYGGSGVIDANTRYYSFGGAGLGPACW